VGLTWTECMSGSEGPGCKEFNAGLMAMTQPSTPWGVGSISVAAGMSEGWQGFGGFLRTLGTLNLV
jgi:hypothetical protein